MELDISMATERPVCVPSVLDFVIGEHVKNTDSSSDIEQLCVNSSEFVSSDAGIDSNVDVRSEVFYPPVSRGGRVVEIFRECLDGNCTCPNPIGGVHCNLRPCRIGSFLFSGECVLPSGSVTEIWDGLCDGFNIVDDNCDMEYDCENYLSITQGHFRGEMSNLLREEIKEGKVSICEVKPKCIHSLGAVPKSDGRLRPITDCSMPEGSSINNFMSSTCKEFKYNSVNDVASDLCHNDFMCVVDIASAYRSVPINPSHSKFQGMRWDFDDGSGDVLLQENRLSFGLKCAPYIFSLLSDLVVNIVRSKGVERIVNYLDDFVITESSYERCHESQNILLGVIRQMGFSISWKKVSLPSRKTVFLGITIDSVAMNLSIPPEKISKFLIIIQDLEREGKASKKQLERLGGLVSHFSSVIRGGRTFCRRIYNLFSKCPKNTKVTLDQSILLDLAWWKNLCNSFNGSAKIIGRNVGGTVTTDASTWGFGGWSEGDWFLGCWEGTVPEEINVHNHIVLPPGESDCFDKNINVYELYAVLAAVRRWGPDLKDSQIQVVTDNTQVVYMINTGRSANYCCMAWLRELFWLCFIFNVELFAMYINTRDNTFADALSRADNSSSLKFITDTVSNLNLCCHNMLQ